MATTAQSCLAASPSPAASSPRAAQTPLLPVTGTMAAGGQRQKHVLPPPSHATGDGPLAEQSQGVTEAAGEPRSTHSLRPGQLAERLERANRSCSIGKDLPTCSWRAGKRTHVQREGLSQLLPLKAAARVLSKEPGTPRALTCTPRAGCTPRHTIAPITALSWRNNSLQLLCGEDIQQQPCPGPITPRQQPSAPASQVLLVLPSSCRCQIQEPLQPRCKARPKRSLTGPRKEPMQVYKSFYLLLV